MDTRKFVMDVRDIQKQYAEMYDEHEGLVSINPYYVQVSVKMISDLVFEYSIPWELNQVGELTEDYPWEVKIQLNGTTFCAVGTTEKFIECGFLNKVES